MSVVPVTPPDAASDPAHPEHDRWVKEQTLRMEVEHAKLIGIPLAVAEAENMRMLQRADRLAAQAAVITQKPRTPSVARAQRHEQRGVTRKAPAKQRSARGCICGRCIMCKRNQRVLALFQRKQSGDVSVLGLVHEMGNASLAASAGVGRFKGLSKLDTRRLLASIVDGICDRSVAAMGPWR